MRKTGNPRPQLLLFGILILCGALLCCACALPAAKPDADTLMAVFRKPFSCGFEAVSENRRVCGTFTRLCEEDQMNITGAHGNTVFVFSGGNAYLKAGEKPDSAGLSLPVTLPEDSGAAYCHALFSVLPDATWNVQKQGDTLLVSDEKKTFTAVFTKSGIPLSLSDGKTTLTISAFSQLPEQDSYEKPEET